MKFYALRLYERDKILFWRQDLLRRYSLVSSTDIAINRARGGKFKILRPAALNLKQNVRCLHANFARG